MLTHPTLDRLQALGLHGMARAFAELRDNVDAADLAFEDRLGLMLDREADLRVPSSVRPAAARPGWPAPSATEPAARTSQSSMSAGRASPKIWRWPAPTVAIPSSWQPSAGSSCSFSTIGAWHQ